MLHVTFSSPISADFDLNCRPRKTPKPDPQFNLQTTPPNWRGLQKGTLITKDRIRPATAVTPPPLALAVKLDVTLSDDSPVRPTSAGCREKVPFSPAHLEV
jgi:hypothetical protein